MKRFVLYRWYTTWDSVFIPHVRRPCRPKACVTRWSCVSCRRCATHNTRSEYSDWFRIPCSYSSSWRRHVPTLDSDCSLKSAVAICEHLLVFGLWRSPISVARTHQRGTRSCPRPTRHMANGIAVGTCEPKLCGREMNACVCVHATGTRRPFL